MNIRHLALIIGNVGITPPNGIPSNGLNDGGKYSLVNILTVGIGYLLIVAILVAFFYIIFGGFKWMTSGGDSAKITAARQIIIYAIIGLIIAFAAFMIIGIIGNTLKVNVFQ